MKKLVLILIVLFSANSVFAANHVVRNTIKKVVKATQKVEVKIFDKEKTIKVDIKTKLKNLRK